MLDFFLENIGKSIYNKSLDDAKYWLSKRISDIEMKYDDLYK